jgi:hypothetical protein
LGSIETGVRKKNGGGPGIRTPGRLLTVGGFQDRCIQPLCQPTVLPKKRQKAYFRCCRCDSGWNDTGFAITVNALKKKRWKFHWFWSRCEQDYTSLMESIGAFSVVND